MLRTRLWETLRFTSYIILVWTMGFLLHVTFSEGMVDTVALQTTVRGRILEEHERYNSSHSQLVKYTVGEVVFLRRPPEHTKSTMRIYKITKQVSRTIGSYGSIAK